MMDLERQCSQGHRAYLGRSLTPQEGWLLYGLIRLTKPNTVVEIGRLEGISTQWIGEALKDQGQGHLHSIDLTTKREATKRLVAYVQERIVTIHEFSSHGNEAEKLADRLRAVDFLFVDGDHRTEAVMADCRLWLPRTRGWALFHDLGQPGVREATQRAIWWTHWTRMELPAERPERGDAVMLLLHRRFPFPERENDAV